MTSICLLSRAARHAVLGAVLSSSSPAGAQAGEAPGPCEPLEVEAEAALLDRLPALPTEVRLAFAERDDVDTCARVWLSQRGRSIAVEVRLGDGRSASRLVPDARDVIPTLQALLLLPGPEATAVSSSSPERAAPESRQEQPPTAHAPAPRAPDVNAMLDEPDSPAPTHQRRRGWGLEASLVGGAHIGDGQTRSSLGGLCVADLWSWLAGFEVRAADYAPSPGGADVATYTTLEFALLGGHRIRGKSLALDLFAGPSFMLHATESVVEGPAGTRRSSSSQLLARLRVASHVNFAPRSLFGPFVGVEGELGPAERMDAAAPSPGADPDAEYPGWMVGVVLGATVGTR